MQHRDLLTRAVGIVRDLPRVTAVNRDHWPTLRHAEDDLRKLEAEAIAEWCRDGEVGQMPTIPGTFYATIEACRNMIHARQAADEHHDQSLGWLDDGRS